MENITICELNSLNASGLTMLPSLYNTVSSLGGVVFVEVVVKHLLVVSRNILNSLKLKETYSITTITIIHNAS